MFKFIRSLRARKGSHSAFDATPSPGVAPPEAVTAPDGSIWPIRQHLFSGHGLPGLDWDATNHWINGLSRPEDRLLARQECELAWLSHLREALGPGYSVLREDGVVLLSSLEEKVAKATLSYVRRTRQRIVRVLAGLAHAPKTEREILVVFDSQDEYYGYVGQYYPDEGSFATSGGMFIDAGCGHFVTMKDELHAIEPVIAHELTHARLAHLPLPKWLDEGLAVNTEDRLCPKAITAFSQKSTPQQMRSRHRRYWQGDKIQSFWSGRSFEDPGVGQELSYDLARIMVGQLARDWEPFRQFSSAADRDDGGAFAARHYLGAGLGQIVCTLLELEWTPQMEPAPSGW